MTSNDFCRWLDGYLGDGRTLLPEEIAIVRGELAKVAAPAFYRDIDRGPGLHRVAEFDVPPSFGVCTFHHPFSD